MLEIKNLTKKFGNKTIINSLSIKIPTGQILAIVGPSGAGKTTLLRCIIGLENVDSGEFFWNGHQFDPTNSDPKNSIVGAVFQNYQLFPNLTVMENIILAPVKVKGVATKLAKDEAQKMLDQLDLSGKENLYPYQLSGGQQQRVAIVRALAMNPKILCYDEPTSALDPDLRKEVAKLILNLKKDAVTQIVITHDMEFAENVADEILKVTPIK
ncbi:amino acid ABC transporter ATP-binding protein [Lentilactobacillus laojiaonis]|uniref:amino acid ABC transporter ATP-binding protein n=1 Tax=Lentilactobacillus laojiaonis TaxID=2883998 RepID=UPI001D0B4A65|nr:amino acid ABC transporter ATP-binding protein [Lentilactobacillus laojiaonis]UDM31725.1 amino acid ABC transporter ATP-binding protein [Lentilactobacillus laojiaonis]